MNFSMRDLYPCYMGAETSTEVIPEVDDQKAMTENSEEVETSNTHFARGKNILLAVGVLVAVVIFLGGAE